MMLIPTTTVIAYRCPACGRLEFHALSLFAFAGGKNVKVDCTCGTALFGLSSKDRERFWMQAHCVMCDSVHVLSLSRKELWDREVTELLCEETGLEIGYVGPREKIKELLEERNHNLAKMAEELGFGDYFKSPEIMYQVLENIYQIAENGSLYCQCGNFNVEIEIYPDRLDLRCDRCQAKMRVWAETEEDLEIMEKTWEIQLSPGATPGQGGRRRSPRHHFKK